MHVQPLVLHCHDCDIQLEDGPKDEDEKIAVKDKNERVDSALTKLRSIVQKTEFHLHQIPQAH